MTDEKTTATRPPLRAVVVSLPTKRTIRAEHAEHLRASGLTDETVELAQLYSESSAQRLADIVGRSSWPTLCGAAIVFPFYRPGASEPHAFRVRPSVARIEKRGKGKKDRTVKYDQAAHHGQLVYFTPRARRDALYADISRPLVWTEGEKKALALDQLGYAVIGLTGVWNWGDKKYKDDTGGERLHPDIAQHVAVAGRESVIVFDADSRDNDQVMLAARRLTGVLLAAGATAVRFTAPPDAAAKGIDDYYAAHGDAATRALLAAAQPIEPADPKQPLQHARQLAALRDSPLPDWLRVPAAYEVARDGSLWTADERVTGSPLFVTRELFHLVDGDERVELTYAVGDDWRTLRASRKAVCDSRAMVADLAPFGAPVSSDTAAKLVRWLDAQREANAGDVPRIACVDATGWHHVDGADVFMLDAPIGAAAERLALDARGDGVRALAALRPRGSLDVHCAALRRAWETDPVAAVVIAASFAAPLLRPLGADNFGVHMPGESSRGKSSMLKIAASVYGDPRDPGWLANWNATGAGIEGRAVRLNHLPQCYDEVGSGAADPKQTERLVYSLINGGGRTRMTREMQLRATQSWQTIVISTGERELTDDMASTGAQVRCVQLPVRRFGELTGEEVDALREECVAHSGSAGRAWVERLVDFPASDWATFRELHALVTRELRAVATDGTLQGRVAAYFATLVVCEVMLAAELQIGDSDGQTMRDAFVGNGAGRERLAGVADRARELVEAAVFREPDSFPPYAAAESMATRNGRPRLGFRRDDDIYMLKSSFEDLMRAHGLEPRTVIREWLDRGETEVDNDGRLAKKVYGFPRCVVLKPPTKAGQT
jgi:hypothetical protein